jgi:hypothetical protein
MCSLEWRVHHGNLMMLTFQTKADVRQMLLIIVIGYWLLVISYWVLIVKPLVYYVSMMIFHH